MQILEPLNPVKPKIGISAPLLIGNCDSYILDLSSSTGNCGRTFSNISFSVSTNGNISEAIVAERVLNNLFQISPPTSIPSGTFPEGLNNIQIKLCNFFGVCSQASTQLNVLSNAAPVVTIYGKSTITMESLSSLVLFGDATMTTCSNKISSTKRNLQYTWLAYKNHHQIFNLTSISKRKNVFKLKPYALLPNNLYTLQLIVLDSKSSQTSMQSVNVNVIDSNIVAIIDGGEERTVQLGETFVLDASRSYDMRIGKKCISVNNITYFNFIVILIILFNSFPNDMSYLLFLSSFLGPSLNPTGFSFSWSCLQISPNVSNSCGVLLPVVTNESVLTLVAPTTSVPTRSYVTVSYFYF